MKLINLIPSNFTDIKVLTKEEFMQEMENPCWKGYEMVGTKSKDGREVPNCVPVNEETSDDEYDVVNEKDTLDFVKFLREYNKQLSEATCDCLLEGEYQGRDVPLGKPMAGDVKKFKVYVKNPSGKVVKVNF